MKQEKLEELKFSNNCVGWKGAKALNMFRVVKLNTKPVKKWHPLCQEGV